MVCDKCGAEIESGFLYCPKCGESVQLVPNYDVLEEELLSRVVEDKDKSKDDKFATGVYSPIQDTIKSVTSLNKNSSASTFERNKSFITKLVLFLFIIVVGCCLIFGYLDTHSYDNLMNNAVAAESKKEYAKALGYYEGAYQLDSTSFEAIYGLGRMYYRVKDYEDAVTYLTQALEEDPTNPKIYTYLLECYAALNDSDSIYALSETAPNEQIEDLFSAYMVMPPEFSEEEGEYTEDMVLFLSTPYNYQIFYTTDGKDPTVSGKLYHKGIKLTEGTTEIKAICMSNTGEYSEVVAKTYTISYEALATPVVTPGAGTFTEQVYISISVPTGASAYYTWDGSVPSETNGTLYSQPFPIISGASVLSVIIIDSRGNTSPLYQGDYILID